jgi:RHS repeat-associated protein
MFGLINMNARLYDPALGRFLSPDPYVQAPDFSQSFNRYSYCLNNPLKYTDESGEYCLFDDLLAGLIGGVVNWATNGCKFSNQGLSYFGVGFAGGIVTIYTGIGGGAIVGYGNSVIGQGFGEQGKWNSKNVDWGGEAVKDGLIGAGTAYLGGQVAGKIASKISPFTSKLGGPVVQDMLTGSLTSGATGFTLGAGLTAINGGNFEESMRAGWNSAKVGLVTGTVDGLISGIDRSCTENVNPITGKSKIDITADDLDVSPTMDRIKAGESYPHRNDGGTFQNNKDILPVKSPDYYKEYVHPTPGIKGPGPQRIIKGIGGEHYYSPDHYRTFIRFKH